MLPCLNRMSTAPTPERIEHLERDNLRLRRAVEELSIINEVASAVTSTWSLDKIIDSIVQKCVKHLDVDQGNVSLFAEEEEETALRTMVRRVDSRLDSNPFRIGTQLSGWMLKNQAPLIINDIAADGRFRPPGLRPTSDFRRRQTDQVAGGGAVARQGPYDRHPVGL